MKAQDGEDPKSINGPFLPPLHEYQPLATAHKMTGKAFTKKCSWSGDSLQGRVTKYHNALHYKANAHYKCLIFTQHFGGLQISSGRTFLILLLTVPLHPHKLF